MSLDFDIYQIYACGGRARDIAERIKAEGIASSVLCARYGATAAVDFLLPRVGLSCLEPDAERQRPSDLARYDQTPQPPAVLKCVKVGAKVRVSGI